MKTGEIFSIIIANIDLNSKNINHNGEPIRRLRLQKYNIILFPTQRTSDITLLKFLLWIR